jgi:hypothetical protein
MPSCGVPLGLPAFAAPAFRVHASAQCIHEIDDLRRCALSWNLDLLTGLLLLQQVLQRILVVVLKFLRLEVPRLGPNDVRCQGTMHRRAGQRLSLPHRHCENIEVGRIEG